MHEDQHHLPMPHPTSSTVLAPTPVWALCNPDVEGNPTADLGEHPAPHCQNYLFVRKCACHQVEQGRPFAPRASDKSITESRPNTLRTCRVPSHSWCMVGPAVGVPAAAASVSTAGAVAAKAAIANVTMAAAAAGATARGGAGCCWAVHAAEPISIVIDLFAECQIETCRGLRRRPTNRLCICDGQCHGKDNVTPALPANGM